jgi:hypothetical protein
MEDRDAGTCRTPHTCTYRVGGEALVKLLQKAAPKGVAERVLKWATSGSEEVVS